MKKITALILAACLILSGCSGQNNHANDEGSQTSENKTITDISDYNQNSSEYPNVKYLKFVPENIKNHFSFQEAAKSENSVINVFYDVITTEKPVIDFMEKLKNKTPAALDIYYFRDDEYFSEVICRSISYDGETMKYVIKSFSKPGEVYKDTEKEIVNIFDLGKDEFTFTEDEPLTITSAEIINKDILSLQIDSYSEPVYIEYMNKRDLFPNYDEMQEVYNKYILPLYIKIIQHEAFENPEDFASFSQLNWCDIVEGMVRGDLIESGGDFWTLYPEGLISFEDFMKYINRSFEVDESVIKETFKDSLTEDNMIEHLGGRGGAYPEVIVLDKDDSGDMSFITCAIRSIVDGSFDDTEVVVTVKNMPDGTFRYISLNDKK